MHLEFGFDSRSAVTLFPYSSTAEQRAVNSKVPRSNRGGGVGRTGNVRFFHTSRDYHIRLTKGDWRSGSAAALHADGRWFESDISHYK